MISSEYSTAELLGGLNETERKNAPARLFAAGHVGLLRRGPRVSVIGSRKASAEGLEKARIVARVILERQGVVVSGLAEGVDAAAHLAAVESDGATIAVIGTPLERAYPKKNETLQRRLMEEQLVVSQFGPGYPTTPKNFVMRNRTMALISNACVIVEAGEKSGTEHQGWEAIRLGRVLLLPDKLVRAGFEWPRKMCDYGAISFGSKSELEALLDEHLPTVRAEAYSALPF